MGLIHSVMGPYRRGGSGRPPPPQSLSTQVRFFGLSSELYDPQQAISGMGHRSLPLPDSLLYLLKERLSLLGLVPLEERLRFIGFYPKEWLNPDFFHRRP